MRDGQKATRSASNRSKTPKEPLGRVGTTTSRPGLTRAPSSMDATLAAGAAIDRHGTPMHPAITKPRDSSSKPQPVRRPTRDTNPPSPILEDVDLEMNSGSMSSRSTDPSSFGSYSIGARKKESFDSYSTEPDKYSFSAFDDASRFCTETPGTAGQGSPPPRAKDRGCFLNALKNFWEDWKEVNRLGGPSQEALAWEWICEKWSGRNKTTDVERSPRPAAAQPAFELGQFSTGSNRGYHEQAQRAVTPRAPPAAARRDGPERHVLERHSSDGASKITTFTQFMDHGRGARTRSGLRHEVRNDSPQKGTANRHESPTPAFRIRTQGQAPYEHRDDTIDHGFFNDGFDDFDGHHGDDWDRQTRAPTMVSSTCGAHMSHTNSSDLQTVNAHNHPNRPTSSIYTTTTNGHPNPQHYRPETPPSVPAIPGEYLLQNNAPAPPRNPWQETREPVSPMNETFDSSNPDDLTPISPLLESQRKDYVPARNEWSSQKRERHGYEGGEDGEVKRGTDFYDFYRESGPVFSEK